MTSKMRLNADRLMELKQSPRSADVTDIEDLCDEVERLRTVLTEISTMRPTSTTWMAVAQSALTHETPGEHS